MKQQYSLTSIWYWSLNSIAFIVATFGTVQAIIPIQRPSVKTPQTVKEAFDISFNLDKPNTLNNLNKPNFKLTLLPLPNAETQKCQVFSCLPANPFHNYDAQPNDLPSLNLQQNNYRYASLKKECHSSSSVMLPISRRVESLKSQDLQDASLRCTEFSMTIFNSPSSNIESYKLNTNINSRFNRTEIFIPIKPIQEKNTPIASQQTKPQTNNSSSKIFSHTYESVSLPQTQPAKKITVGDAVYLALKNGAYKNAIIVKTPRVKPNYTWNETNDTTNINFKLSLIKDTDSKIARWNQLINKQDTKNALSSKITNVILAYIKLQEAQEKVRIAEDTLNIAKTKEPVNLTNYRIALLVAKNQVEARKLELTSILGLDRKTQIVASDIPVIKPIPLDFDKLEQIALKNQPNYGSNQLKLELSKLKQTLEAETVFELDTQLQNSIGDINSISSQLEGAKQATKLAQQLIDTEHNINKLTNARNNELDLTIQYLNALTNARFVTRHYFRYLANINTIEFLARPNQKNF